MTALFLTALGMLVFIYAMPTILTLTCILILHFHRKRRLDNVIKDADNAMKALAGAKTMEDLKARYERVEEILEFARVVQKGRP